MVQKTKEAFSSQSLISLSQIKNGVIILKNGTLRSVLEVSGINLNLKSEDEQNTILTSWRNLLNNLEFSLEIVIHSRHLNIDPYLNFLEERVSKEQTELLKLQGEDYYSFIKGLVTENNIMRKKFYLIVPYDPVIIRPRTALSQIAGSFKSMLNLGRESFNILNTLSNEEFNQYYQQLMIRRDNVNTNLYRLGLSARPLETKELIEIFFNLYNPETFEKESLTLPEEFNK